jgi:hypothetical protein
LSEARINYYKIPEVEALLINVFGKNDVLNPVFDLKIGYRYPEVEEATNFDASKTLVFLEQLHKAGLLDRKAYDIELRCPYCNSPNVSVHYLCSNCETLGIKKTILFEHFPCGYLGPVSSLGAPISCPKCGNMMVEGEYRNAGSIYECDACNQQLETPYVGHWCRDCNKKFNFDNSIYQPSYSYSLGELTQEDVTKGILYISNVTGVFQELGLTRVQDLKIDTASGIEQTFDAVFEGSNVRVFFDLIYSEAPIAEMVILKEYSKIIDVKDNVFVVAMPGLDQRASVVVRSYNLNLVEAATPDEALSKLKALLTEKLPTLNVVIKVDATPQKKRRW